ncbi:acyl-CoA thioesterase [Lutibacter sp. A64]|uniref:acyl-CoA thioesterase n=1 Tax=Lutibacter sp. A64 TaxID=2918526 RepID=UPI001F0641C5|nr:thioesterase family protein [Lutibacter sp. A64]UMB53884.1 acyl-CoA thioesterase [Lutibacter sp. A64]
MISDKIEFRVRYGETDQMSYAYHGNYAAYFEMGRTEWLRKLGISYKKMEEDGIMLPVINLNTNYLKPAKYDDVLTLKTTLAKIPTARIEFKFEITNQQNELLTTATAVLVFVNMKTNRPTRIPKYLLDKINTML